MQVHTPQPRMINHGRRDLLPKRDHHHQIRRGQFLRVDIPRPHRLDASSGRKLRHRSTRQLPPPPRRPIRLRKHPRHLMPRREQPRQRRNPKLAATNKNNSHGKIRLTARCARDAEGAEIRKKNICHR